MTQDWYSTVGRIDGGKLTLTHREEFTKALTRFPDGPVSIDIKVEKPTRSSQQNRYWHGVVIPAFSEHCGYDVAEMKDALALELIPTEVTNFKTGEITIAPGHTSRLTVSEFNSLIERAQRLGAEMGIYIPDPEEFGHGD